MSAPQPPGVPRLVCLCVAHVDALERLAGLTRMLRSWCQQRPGPPPPLYLGLSVGGGVDWRAVHRALEPWTTGAVGEGRAPPPLRVVLQTPAAGTMARLAALVAGPLPEEGEEAGRATVWVMLTEEDAVWHPDRAETYRSTIEDVHGRAASPADVERACVSVQAYAAPGADEAGEVFAPSPHDVDAALDAGRLVLAHQAQPRHHEPWMLAATLPTLRAFAAAAGPIVLDHPLAGTFWVRHLRHQPGRRIHEVDPVCLPRGWAVAVVRATPAHGGAALDVDGRTDHLIVLCAACGSSLDGLRSAPEADANLTPLLTALGAATPEERAPWITAVRRALAHRRGAGERYGPFFRAAAPAPAET